MLEALLRGQTDPSVLADLAKGRLREKSEQPAAALSGRVRQYHRFMIAEHLEHLDYLHLDYLDEAIERVSIEIEEGVCPFVSEGQMEMPDSVPGISERVGQVLVAEIGTEH